MKKHKKKRDNKSVLRKDKVMPINTEALIKSINKMKSSLLEVSKSSALTTDQLEDDIFSSSSATQSDEGLQEGLTNAMKAIQQVKEYAESAVSELDYCKNVLRKTQVAPVSLPESQRKALRLRRAKVKEKLSEE